MSPLPLWLAKNQVSNDVVALQYALNVKYGWPRRKLLKLDGIFGPDTETIVRAFQEYKHLTVDGIAGPHTLNRLFSWVKLTDQVQITNTGVPQNERVGSSYAKPRHLPPLTPVYPYAVCPVVPTTKDLERWWKLTQHRFETWKKLSFPKPSPVHLIEHNLKPPALKSVCLPKAAPSPVPPTPLSGQQVHEKSERKEKSTLAWDELHAVIEMGGLYPFGHEEHDRHIEFSTSVSVIYAFPRGLKYLRPAISAGVEIPFDKHAFPRRKFNLGMRLDYERPFHLKPTRAVTDHSIILGGYLVTGMLAYIQMQLLLQHGFAVGYEIGSERFNLAFSTALRCGVSYIGRGDVGGGSGVHHGEAGLLCTGGLEIKYGLPVPNRPPRARH